MPAEKIVFLGTPDFAVAVVNQLYELKADIIAVVCQPDKPSGRHSLLTPPPVKIWAQSHDIKVLQPYKLRNEYQSIIDLKPDMIFCCAYGQFIPDALLAYPTLGCLNVHPSLLPKLRGGAPIQHAVLDGYKQTGVSLMIMSSRMDSGDVIAQKTVAVEDEDTFGSLQDKLVAASLQLISEYWPALVQGQYPHQAQNDEEATFGYNIKPEDEHIDFSRSYQQVYDQIRGLNPYPGGYAQLDGQKVKIWQTRKSDLYQPGPNGTICFEGKKVYTIIDGRLLEILKLQPAGKSAMDALNWKNGAGRQAEGKIWQ